MLIQLYKQTDKIQTLLLSELEQKQNPFYKLHDVKIKAILTKSSLHVIYRLLQPTGIYQNG
jgi:hypothetical protein